MTKIVGTVLSFSMVFAPAFALAQALPTDTAPTTEEMTPPTEETAPEIPAGPSISSVSVTDITDTSARIDVNSDEMVQGYVEYGTDEQYGMSTPLTSEFSTSPSFLLENLSPEMLYHYRVVVVDSAGTAAITGDETFTTLATSESKPEPEQPTTDTSTPTTTPSTGSGQAATTTPPTTETRAATSTNSTGSSQAGSGQATTTPSAPALAISNTETMSVSTSTARITWQSNKDADGQVQYGTTNAYETLSPVGTVSSSHSISLSNLAPNTKYYYRAISRTSSGETAYSPAETFTTLEAQAAATYPVISDVATAVTATSTAISWTTSEPATSDIEYGTTTSYGSSVGEDGTLRTSHTRTFGNPAPPGTYHFRVISADSEGNISFGKDRTFSIGPTTSPGSGPTASTSAEILGGITERAAQAATAPQGGGGIPVAPFHPLLLKVTPLDGQVAFDWLKDTGVQNGTIHTLIVRKQGADPVRSRTDGEIIYDGPSTTFTDTNVQNGVEYHYALYSYGAYGRFTTAARFKVIPQAGEEQVNFSAAETTVDTPPTFSRDLHQGKQGDDVAALQSHLVDNGYYPEALITGYFGPLTRAAVIRYQTLNSIVPAVGYVGPITRGVLEQ